MLRCQGHACQPPIAGAWASPFRKGGKDSADDLDILLGVRGPLSRLFKFRPLSVLIRIADKWRRSASYLGHWHGVANDHKSPLSPSPRSSRSQLERWNPWIRH